MQYRKAGVILQSDGERKNMFCSIIRRMPCQLTQDEKEIIVSWDRLINRGVGCQAIFFT